MATNHWIRKRNTHTTSSSITTKNICKRTRQAKKAYTPKHIEAKSKTHKNQHPSSKCKEERKVIIYIWLGIEDSEQQRQKAQKKRTLIVCVCKTLWCIEPNEREELRTEKKTHNTLHKLAQKPRERDSARNRLQS